MIANYSKGKDVYYNNTVYRVPIDDLKHINKVDVEFNGKLVKCISNLDLYRKIENELTTEVSIKCTVIFDKEKNIWIVLNKTDKQYKKYIETKSK